MLEILLIILIVVLYFVGGSLFSVAYVKGYPQDTRPNLGLMVLFWVFIVIFHVVYQTAGGIGKSANRLATGLGEDPKALKKQRRISVPRSTGISKDNGPGTK